MPVQKGGCAALIHPTFFAENKFTLTKDATSVYWLARHAYNARFGKTTSHLTKLSINDSQVPGYAEGCSICATFKKL
jgi:hypothetical protein